MIYNLDAKLHKLVNLLKHDDRIVPNSFKISYDEDEGYFYVHLRRKDNNEQYFVFGAAKAIIKSFATKQPFLDPDEPVNNFVDYSTNEDIYSQDIWL